MSYVAGLISVGPREQSLRRGVRRRGHLGSCDRYIGWSAEARRRNIGLIAYNTRFLILPWVRIENLASHILGRMAARISEDWQKMYGHPIYFLEAFQTLKMQNRKLARSA